jgi:hypothetical protein
VRDLVVDKQGAIARAQDAAADPVLAPPRVAVGEEAMIDLVHLGAHVDRSRGAQLADQHPGLDAQPERDRHVERVGSR